MMLSTTHTSLSLYGYSLTVKMFSSTFEMPVLQHRVMKDAFIVDILMALIAVVIAIILFHIKLRLNSEYREQLGYISLEETFPLN